MSLALKGILLKNQRNYFNVLTVNHFRYYTMGLITNTFLTSNISMAIKPYEVLNTFIYKILFDLSESSKIT